MKKEFLVQDLCSDVNKTIVLTLCVICSGTAILALVIGLMFLAALFT